MTYIKQVQNYIMRVCLPLLMNFLQTIYFPLLNIKKNIETRLSSFYVLLLA